MKTLPIESMTADDHARAERVRVICGRHGWPFTGLIDPRSMKPGREPQNQIDRTFDLLMARLGLIRAVEGGAS